MLSHNQNVIIIYFGTQREGLKRSKLFLNKYYEKLCCVYDINPIESVQ